jgi:hypothetical protein
MEHIKSAYYVGVGFIYVNLEYPLQASSIIYMKGIVGNFTNTVYLLLKI